MAETLALRPEVCAADSRDQGPLVSAAAAIGFMLTHTLTPGRSHAFAAVGYAL